MSAQDPAIRPAQHADYPAILALLTASRLPTGDLNEDAVGRFIVAQHDGSLIGVCGLDVFGGDGLPRSLAVAPDWRGRGLGAHLLAENERRARSAGVTVQYLLTSSAQPYLLRHGYEDIARDAVPEAIAAHPQFRGLCPASAKCMRKLLK